MKYTLMRIRHYKGTIFSCIIFEFWNSQYKTGYDIELTINCTVTAFHERVNIILPYVGKTYDIGKWDKIIRDLKSGELI